MLLYCDVQRRCAPRSNIYRTRLWKQLSPCSCCSPAVIVELEMLHLQPYHPSVVYHDIELGDSYPRTNGRAMGAGHAVDSLNLQFHTDTYDQRASSPHEAAVSTIAQNRVRDFEDSRLVSESSCIVYHPGLRRWYNSCCSAVLGRTLRACVPVVSKMVLPLRLRCFYC
ncbi:hypothetical protein BDW22DRAFT_1208998 [Trametopsis cervina]|nr:hypothetical protein BDW22DRAFT_1208998 [Trametopsis cervina]